MEFTMTNNFGFCDLNESEMMLVDGGGTVANAIICGACAVAAGALGLAIAGPVGAAVAAKIGGVAGSVVCAGINIGVSCITGYVGNKVANWIISM